MDEIFEQILMQLQPIAPYWAKHIRQDMDLKVPMFDDNDSYSTTSIWRYRISQFHTCIVGEAWHGSEYSRYVGDEHYTCDVCFALAEALGHSYQPDMKRQFIQELMIFIGHWNKVHNLDGKEQR